MTEEERAAAEAAAKEAAEKAAAEKAKADQEAADKAAADKTAAEKTAAEKAAEQEAAKDAEAKTALEAEIARLKAEVEKFNGLDPEAARKALADAEAAQKKVVEAEKERLKAEGNFEKLRELQQAEIDAQLKAAAEAKEAAEKEAAEARAEMQRSKIETAFANSKFLADETILSGPKAQRLFGDHVEVEDGKVVVYDAPAGSDKRAKVMDAKGNPLPFNEAIKAVIEADADKDTLLRTKVTPGAGSKTTDGKSAPAEKSRHDRIRDGLAALRKG